MKIFFQLILLNLFEWVSQALSIVAVCSWFCAARVPCVHREARSCWQVLPSDAWVSLRFSPHFGLRSPAKASSANSDKSRMVFKSGSVSAEGERQAKRGTRWCREEGELAAMSWRQRSRYHELIFCDPMSFSYIESYPDLYSFLRLTVPLSVSPNTGFMFKLMSTTPRFTVSPDIPCIIHSNARWIGVWL